ncbi:hypothetical protein ASZ78_007124 [Callipepla squamata]|uniref:28S ribosomal protein S21, mitochondrial n=1 Tax=Callipepla squamata TaxID=9009 RepID=A0A226MKG8_CALSU|nr:hypothetical protein ASZ78_007124 [Callipepla squamata]
MSIQEMLSPLGMTAPTPMEVELCSSEAPGQPPQAQGGRQPQHHCGEYHGWERCRELRGFIRPLTELLNGLRMGRYDKGLSSFQQSVAMDRIQRIIGVLQKPEMGILSQDGIIESVKLRRYYEKPCRRRQRLAYEACRRVYNAEMARKISFLARKSRADPWLGC